MTSKLIRNLEELPITSYLNNYYKGCLGNNEAKLQASWQIDEITATIRLVGDYNLRALLFAELTEIERALSYFADNVQLVIQQEKDKSDEN